jgi:hypothetical protein
VVLIEQELQEMPEPGVRGHQAHFGQAGFHRRRIDANVAIVFCAYLGEHVIKRREPYVTAPAAG